MKHFINLFVVLVLIGLAIGVAYMCQISTSEHPIWGFAYVPITVFMFLWGIKLNDDY